MAPDLPLFTVRDFSESDFDELVSLWHETNRLSYPYVRAHQEHTRANASDFFRSNVLVECRVWVAESSSRQRLGLLALSGSWIRQLAVFRPFQRQGVGTALLQRAREHSPTQLRLYTFQRNVAARAFYERHGFSAVAFGTSPAPEAEPDIEFCWQAA
jgi:ribosomal protein S18 acetylase RimI-like enzyme